jgi:hypothetical protein
VTLRSAIALTLIVLGLGPAPGFAEEKLLLQLDVLIWGKPIVFIGAFQQSSDGSLSAERKELEALGLKVPDRYHRDDEVALSDLPGVRYRYNEALQLIDIAVDDERRLPKIYDARPVDKPIPNDQSSTGVVLNYLLFGGAGSNNSLVTNWQFQGVSATLDARFFSPIGIFSQSGILASDSGNGVISQRLRLDSAWTYADPGSALVYRAGDTISGGLVWTRPIRLGGFQAQSDFAVRPDLVTLAPAKLQRQRGGSFNGRCLCQQRPHNLADRGQRSFSHNQRADLVGPRRRQHHRPRLLRPRGADHLAFFRIEQAFARGIVRFLRRSRVSPFVLRRPLGCLCKQACCIRNLPLRPYGSDHA